MVGFVRERAKILAERRSEERFHVSVYEKCAELRVYSVSKSQSKFSKNWK